MSILVVGAGFAGAVVARELANTGYKVNVIEKRDHIAGNAFDYTNEHGIRIHKYGPHLFHTNNKKVWDWVTQFAVWTEYRHRVKAILSTGQYVTLPINRETKEIVGEDNIVSTFYAPYTYKMWGKTIEELDPSVTKRLAIRDDDNEEYFPNDDFQGVPRDGYEKLFQNIFDHENITVELDKPFEKYMEGWYEHVFNSMAIDEYYDYEFGELPYRSIKFHNVDLPLPKLLPATVVNFTHDGPYTRMTEWKNMPSHGVNDSMTSITYEEPCDYKDNDYERYYPVKDVDGSNREIYNSYKNITKGNMTFIGRCGMYVYVDMHQAISSSLATTERFIKEKS